MGIVEKLGKKEEWKSWTTERTFKTHQEKVGWAHTVFLNLGIEDPYDKMILSRLQKDGVTMAFKRKAEDQQVDDNLKKQIAELVDEVAPDVEDSD